MSSMIVWHNGVLSDPWQTPFQNPVFNGILEKTTTLDDILDAIQECCENLTQLILGNQIIVANNQLSLKKLLTCCEKNEEKQNAIFAAIFDLRRELLRGNRDIRR